jgi:hypothetical protein
MEPCSVTLVTAFYPINSKFPSNQYLAWATQFLTLDCPIVLFTTPELAPTFRAMRLEGKPLQIYEVPFSELHMWSTYSSKWKEHHALDHESSYHSPELYAIWAQKVVFVDEAIRLNPFQTDYFFWCDIGAFREGSIESVVRTSFPKSRHLPKDRIALCSVNPLEECDDVLENGIHGNFQYKCRLVGGLWGGGIEGCRRWRRAYEDCLNLYFEKGRFAGKDQNVMLSAYLADPSLATIYTPEKREDWFYFQRLHSDMGLTPVIDSTYL